MWVCEQKSRKIHVVEIIAKRQPYELKIRKKIFFGFSKENFEITGKF